jgi:hypothetical protein
VLTLHVSSSWQQQPTQGGIVIIIEVLVVLVAAAAAAAVDMCWHAGAGAGSGGRPHKVVSCPLKGGPKIHQICIIIGGDTTEAGGMHGM